MLKISCEISSPTIREGGCFFLVINFLAVTVIELFVFVNVWGSCELENAERLLFICIVDAIAYLLTETCENLSIALKPFYRFFGLLLSNV